MGTLADRVEVLEQLPWVDPNLANAITTDKVQVAVCTEGPHRLTIYVPWSNAIWTVVNLGAEHNSRDFGNGIFMRTREHIHWQTPETYVCMGGPSTHITWGRDTVPGESSGYSLITQHDAYHHADLQHLLTSLTKDMVARAKTTGSAVLQSDAGVAEVNSGTQMRLNAGSKLWLTATSGYEPATATYSHDNAEAWPNVAHEKGVTYYANKVGKIASIAQASVGLLGDLAGNLVKCVEGGFGTKSAAAVAFGKAALTAAKVVTAANGFFDREESIKGSADVGVAIWGNRNATIYADIATTVGSLGVSLLGAATADVKGYATAGVWGGKQACLVSNKQLTTVAAFFGSTSVDAGTTASFVAGDSLMVTSLDGNVTMRGGAKAAVYGGKRAYVGSWGKYGMVVDGKAIDFGPVSSGKDFAAAKVKPNEGVYVNDQRILFVWKEAKIAMSKSDTILRYKKAGIKLSSSGLSAKAKNINIDA